MTPSKQLEKDRKKSFKDNFDRLERSNKIAVGREIRMTDMGKKIEKYIDVDTGEVKSSNKDVILRSNSVGSCIVIVAYDPIKNVGALAHVMVPGTAPGGRTFQKTRYAVNAIDDMIRKMTELGAEKNDIETCLVGGGNILKRNDDFICESNITSVLGILNEKNIPIKGKEIGGMERRTVSLDIQTGGVNFTVGDSKEKLLWTFISSPSGEGGEK